jgi:hypothetical protein
MFPYIVGITVSDGHNDKCDNLSYLNRPLRQIGITKILSKEMRLPKSNKPLKKLFG